MFTVDEIKKFLATYQKEFYESTQGALESAIASAEEIIKTEAGIENGNLGGWALLPVAWVVGYIADQQISGITEEQRQKSESNYEKAIQQARAKKVVLAMGKIQTIDGVWV